jgi:hypothetical protein
VGGRIEEGTGHAPGLRRALIPWLIFRSTDRPVVLGGVVQLRGLDLVYGDMEPFLIDLERGDLARQGPQPVLLGHHALLQVGGGGEDLLQHLLGVIRGEGGGHGGRVGWVVVQGGKGGWDDHRRKKPCSEYQGVADRDFYSNLSEGITEVGG